MTTRFPDLVQALQEKKYGIKQSITHPLTLLLCKVRIKTPLFDNYEIISHSYELYIISTIEQFFLGWQVSPIDTKRTLTYL